MRRIGRMLVLLQVCTLAVFAGAASAGATSAGGAIAGSAGEAADESAAAAEWSAADAELAVLNYLIEAQRADAWTAYADAVARMHADVAVLARFGLASPDEAAALEGQRASAAAERNAAAAAKEAARAQLAERLVSAALKTLSELARPVQPAESESAADGGGSGGEASVGGTDAAPDANPDAASGGAGETSAASAGPGAGAAASSGASGGSAAPGIESDQAEAGAAGAPDDGAAVDPAGTSGATAGAPAGGSGEAAAPPDGESAGTKGTSSVQSGGTSTDTKADSGETAASNGESGTAGAAPGNADDGEDASGAPAAAVAVEYPESSLQAERDMRQACRQVEAAALLLKAGVGSYSALAAAHTGCLQAELAWIEVQAADFSALLAGSPESGAGPVKLAALLDMARERQPALYERWVRHLKADAACPADAGASAAVRLTGADGAYAEPLKGCAIGLPGIRIESPQQAVRTASGDVYLPLRPYAAALGLRLEWDAGTRRIVLAAGGARAAVAPGSAVVEWSGGALEMPRAVAAVNGQTYVPAEFFSALFNLNPYWDDHVRAGWLLPESA